MGKPAIQTCCGVALRAVYPVHRKSLSRPMLSRENLSISVSNYGFPRRLMAVPRCHNGTYAVEMPIRPGGSRWRYPNAAVGAHLQRGCEQQFSTTVGTS